MSNNTEVIKVDVLGVAYAISFSNELKDPKLASFLGYCDPSSKEIVINEMQRTQLMDVKNLVVYKGQTLRHELVHAFLFESGLREYSNDEIIVDWIASQLPKLLVAIGDVQAMFNEVV